MEIFQWIFIVGVAITIVAVIFVIYFLFSFIKKGREISREVKRREQGRRRKKQKRLLEDLYRKRKKTFVNLIICFSLAILGCGGSTYVAYYQATNLSNEDMMSLSDGFYYLRDLKEELEAIQSKETDLEKSQQTINFIVTSMAGYSVKKANALNTIDGQIVLNRYYNAIAELGINVSRKSATILTDELNLTESLTDIEKVQIYQKKALEFFKIDISALESQK